MAIVHALKTWRPYLLGQHFKVITDHAALRYIQTQKELTGRQARWLETLQIFDPEFIYKPGKTNVVADALTRMPQRETNTIVTIAIDPQIYQEIQNNYDINWTKEILEQCQRNSAKEVTINRQKFVLENNLLYLQKDSKLILCVPHIGLQQTILYEKHCLPIAGHLGVNKTYDTIKKEFYWPTLEKDVQQYIQSCDQCQRNKPTNKKPSGLLQPLTIPTKPWQSISIDLIVQLPITKQGNTAICTVVDRFSKMTHFIPTTTNVKAPELAEAFFRDIFRIHGLPKSIVSDRDSKFTSLFWRALFKLLGTKLNMSTAYHPESDGQTERANRTVEEMLRHFVSYQQDNWDTLLPGVEFAYNSSKNISTGFSPFYLVYGQELATPAAFISPSFQRTNIEDTDQFLDRMQQTIDLAKRSIIRSQDNQKKYADNKRKQEEFQVGDKVLLNSKHIRDPLQQESKKLSARFLGPFEIISKVGQVAYELQLPYTMQIHPVFHVSLLRRYYEREGQLPPPDPIVITNDQEEYEVEEILAKRIRYKKPEYLVKWKGYKLHDASWESLDNLENAQKAIENFERDEFLMTLRDEVS